MASRSRKTKSSLHKMKKRGVMKSTPKDDNSARDSDCDEDEMFGVNLGDFQPSKNGKESQPDDNDETDEYDDDSNEDEDVMETLEADAEGDQTRKRKHSVAESNSDTITPKKKKKSKADLTKPPTAQEVARLKETENLFHSSLFRLQIEEMLKELSIKPKRLDAFSDWFSSVKESLLAMPKGEKFEIMDQSWVKKLNVAVPLVQKPEAVTGVFKFLPPQSVSVIGSHATGCSLGPDLNVDVAIEMPSNCFQGSDNVNHRYHRKRALYLCHILAHLKTAGLISSDKKFQPHFDLPRALNPLIPVAVVAPTGSLESRAKIYLHITVSQETFKLAKFSPPKNSLRPGWFFDEPNTDGDNFATPMHNASILSDLVAEQNEALKLELLQDAKSIRDGIILLKVWLRQRELDQGISAFGGHVMTMLVVYLLRCHKISSHMSSYQVARMTWNFLKTSEWSVHGRGLTLCDKPVAGAPTLSEFHDHYPVVFVDCSGYYNLTAHLDVTSFTRIKNESALALQYLDNPSVNSFQILFMKPAPFYQHFDHIICFNNLDSLIQMNKEKGTKEARLDKSCHPVRLAADLLLEVLREGLGKRVSEWGIHTPKKLCWKVRNSPSPFSGPLLVGMKLDPEHAYSVLDKGPPANLPEAEEFRKFWGEKSELRRFQDGSISEAILWLPGSDVSLSQRRVVNQAITEYLLQFKMGLNTSECMTYFARQIEEVLALSHVQPTFTYGSGEEAALAVLSSLNKLSKELRALPDLPLDISGVQGSSPVCRFTDVFPPLSSLDYVGQKIGSVGHNCILLDSGFKTSETPLWVPPIEVVLQLALSGKWPDDAQAVRRVRAAFNIKIAELLQEKFDLTSQAFPNYVEVLKDGYVFRLIVAYEHEPTMMRRHVLPDGSLSVLDSKEANLLERETILKPRLTNYLHGLHLQHSAFGPASCLAKRWISAHMIRWSHFPEEAVELIMARIFVSPEPFEPPAQPQTAFLRFLHLLSTTNWHLDPLILNFNNELSSDTVSSIQKRFTSQRSHLPPLFIAIPSEHAKSVWTKEAPSLIILARVALLASESLQILQSCYLSGALLETDMWKKIFRPPLDSYDLVITLDPSANPRKSQWVDVEVSGKIHELRPYKRIAGEKLPVVGYDPVQNYLQELETAYGEYALFFHDIYGGNSIGVVWKPPALEPKEFKVSHIFGRRVEKKSSASNPLLVLNVEALIEDFYILGQGLVQSIDKKKESSI